MICDAHIHVGYFDRKGFDGPFYYSPQRVCSVLRRCGVDEFVFSSTSMQTKGIVFADVHKEAREVVKIWGSRAHPFLWVAKDYLDCDPKLSVLDDGIYEGLKLHGRETPWLSQNLRRKLAHVLDMAAERKMPVIVHTGLDADSHPLKWLKWALRYPDVRFDFAHGAPFETMKRCFSEAANVFADISCVDDADIEKMAHSEYTGRILWGTDFPALAARPGKPLTLDMRLSCKRHGFWQERFPFERTFRSFVGSRDKRA